MRHIWVCASLTYFSIDYNYQRLHARILAGLSVSPSVPRLYPDEESRDRRGLAYLHGKIWKAKVVVPGPEDSSSFLTAL